MIQTLGFTSHCNNYCQLSKLGNAMEKDKKLLSEDDNHETGKDCFYITSGWHKNSESARRVCIDLKQKERNLIVQDLHEKGAIVTNEFYDDVSMEVMDTDEGTVYRYRTGGEIHWRIDDARSINLTEDVTSLYYDIDELDISIDNISLDPQLEH